MIGTVLQESYEITELLGQGGVASVYAAKHLRLPKRFAIKVLSAGGAASEQAVARFYREARVTSNLGHPNIVEVIDFNITEDGLPYLVMELLVGEDLAMRLERMPCLPLEGVSLILRQISSALGAAHHLGVIHRDLKPENIFLCQRGGDDFVKVMDFGMSKVLHSTSSLTREHSLIGTPWYMAPEQIRGRSSEMDQRTDIFALGVMLYEMLSGRRPFEGETFYQVFRQITHRVPCPLRKLRPELPSQLESVIYRALSKQPTDRYHSVGDLLASFRAALIPYRAGAGGGAIAGKWHADWLDSASTDEMMEDKTVEIATDILPDGKTLSDDDIRTNIRPAKDLKD